MSALHAAVLSALGGAGLYDDDETRGLMDALGPVLDAAAASVLLDAALAWRTQAASCTDAGHQQRLTVAAEQAEHHAAELRIAAADTDLTRALGATHPVRGDALIAMVTQEKP